MTETKKRGAPHGNTNALKHGFYSQRFCKTELEKLENTSVILEDEIELLRVLILRVFEAADEGGDNLDIWTKSLRTLGLSLTRLASLLRMQRELTGVESEFKKEITQAVKRTTKEKGIDEQFGPPNK